MGANRRPDWGAGGQSEFSIWSAFQIYRKEKPEGSKGEDVGDTVWTGSDSIIVKFSTFS